ncbi:hypothetical protein ACIQFU_18950 [Streptomyces sp. NPDC093065]|uniref:hypothetical protein n=1 Tax=Streptomyces sp. NPDC093065 TaxID=3366021 RepID=UPI003815D9ED
MIRQHFLRGESLLVRTLESLPSLRIAMEQLADESPALQALHHPGSGKALMAIHGSYREPWTVESPAREAGLSHSVFAQLFRELVSRPCGT